MQASVESGDMSQQEVDEIIRMMEMGEMMQKRLFTTIHEGWLKLLFTSFAMEDREWGETLYDYAEILYRHLRFVEDMYVKRNIEYSWERPGIRLDFTTEGEAARFCDEVLERIALQLSDNGDPLAARMLHDLGYIRGVLQDNFDLRLTISPWNLDGPVNP